ncbi:MAG: hypothetical protein KGI97_02115 [Alphaproteobacteria bacterium]|nr:hypothetical protein [Alphaproteobacteria bacterium]
MAAPRRRNKFGQLKAITAAASVATFAAVSPARAADAPPAPSNTQTTQVQIGNSCRFSQDLQSQADAGLDVLTVATEGAKITPVVGAALSGLPTLYDTGKDIFHGQFHKAFWRFAAGAANTTTAVFLGGIAGEAAAEGVRGVADGIGVKDKNIPDRTSLGNVFNDVNQCVIDGPKPIVVQAPANIAGSSVVAMGAIKKPSATDAAKSYDPKTQKMYNARIGVEPLPPLSPSVTPKARPGIVPSAYEQVIAEQRPIGRLGLAPAPGG